ncbi:BCNT-C domain [Cinara cedri]|uniref:Craniofacial development protein 1 n=1 Tax=Cinara cedri TaxID=506608 RepID=A0A5E4MT27_9HEMI|nr:BCNT-C domain [Cinara cedri]
MDPQDFSDDSDESDLDYKPPGEVEHLSEVDSDDLIEDDEDNANSSTSKSKKRTKGQRSGQKKSKKKYEIDDETVEKSQEEVNSLLNSSEEDKKRLDALWEEFQRPITKKPISKTLKPSQSKSELQDFVKVSDKPVVTKKRNIEELFNSSDSSTKLQNDNNITKPKSPEIPKSLTTTPFAKKQSGGLENILSQIGKKSKLTILEKSKQDWDGYKKEEGIAEELITHNKGKHGYLEKQDFLERADLRQFELEKAMRAANRSHRN